MEKEQIILLCVAGAALVAVVAAFFIGVSYRKKTAENKIGSAELEAEKIKKEAATEAQRAKKEALIEAKDELHRLRTEQERELKERRNEVSHQERRLQQKEENLDKKSENLEKKDELLQAKIKEAEEKLAETETIKRSQLEMLERISGLSTEQAKEMLLKTLDDALTHDKAVRIKQFEQQIKDDSDQIARDIISSAVTRCAADHVSEATVSVVPLPGDDMKGRIIGREGRNIRTL